MLLNQCDSDIYKESKQTEELKPGASVKWIFMTKVLMENNSYGGKYNKMFKYKMSLKRKDVRKSPLRGEGER